jgi:hypothetical protein
MCSADLPERPSFVPRPLANYESGADSTVENMASDGSLSKWQVDGGDSDHRGLFLLLLTCS